MQHRTQYTRHIPLQSLVNTFPFAPSPALSLHFIVIVVAFVLFPLLD